ncbi:MAG: precorrin-6y C5,15-methyltransferase (decarboxylating) subunit CbiE [Magnetococcales bacterium]|nr:precorrin-6y C5,15-methyltransferase (decarboxylating) subunit CbiE [Magnetococcales bacterium]
MAHRCWILGVLDSGPESLTPQAARILGRADLLIADPRFLELYASLAPVGVEQRAFSGQLAAVPTWILQALDAGRRVVVLATGDPLCFGLGSYLLRQLPTGTCRVLGNVSTLQLACERLGLSWGTAHRLSVHGRDSGEWSLAAGPEHALFPLRQVLAQTEPIVVLTSPANGPGRVARMLLTLGWGALWELAVAEALGRHDERLWPWMAPELATAHPFVDPNVLVLRRRPGIVASSILPAPVLGIADAAFVQRTPDRGLITRREVRAVVLAHLGLRPHSRVWDIGAGSGSVGLEAARLVPWGSVHAVEMDAESVRHIEENRQRLGVNNHHLLQARAPAGLEAWPDPDAVFIGGSDGALSELVALCWRRLRPGGHLVMNFATLENLQAATVVLSELAVTWEVVQVQVARSRMIGRMHRLVGENPVWVVVAVKQEADLAAPGTS